MDEIRDVLHFIFLIDTQGFKSFASLEEVCFSTFSCGISVMSLAEWSLLRKCCETVAGLEILEGLSTGLRGVRLNGL